MAGWLSSKLKVAENLLQQIDQQAADSLGKSERKQQDDLDFNTSPKPSGNVPLRDQLKKKTSDNSNSIGPSKLNIDGNSNSSKQKQLGKQVGKSDLNPRSSVLNDSDWTELLSTPKQPSSTRTGRGNGVLRELSVKKVRGTRGNVGLNVSRSVGTGLKIGNGNVLKEDGGVGGRKRDEESGNTYDHHMVSVVGPDDSSSGGSEPGRNLKNLGVHDAKEAMESMDVDADTMTYTNQSLDSGKNTFKADSPFERKNSFDPVVTVVDDKETVVEDETHGRGFLTNDNKNPHGVNNVSDSDSESSSTSDSDSEIEREREAKIQRRRQILAAKAATKAAEAIKERENLVARLEGEKRSLEKIVEERAKEAAQEASELQLSMMEVMEAAELEKQKHNHTRMEVLARLAKIETANADLARSLATAQWNLELEVNRVVDLRQQVEMKEVGHEELKRRILSTCPTENTFSNFILSKGIKFEKEMLEAEYSSLTEKVAGLVEKAMKLDENIDSALKEIGNPTEVEVELKQRLRQMTDYLIQKQAQVEALSSDKAMLIFRIEAVTRLLNENKHLINEADVSGNSKDVEVGRGKGSGSELRPTFEGKLRSGKQHLRSLLRQLDAVFSAGAVFLARNPMAKLWFMVYLVCLHFWVLYILFTHSWSAEDVSSSSVVSLGNMNSNDA